MGLGDWLRDAAESVVGSAIDSLPEKERKPSCPGSEGGSSTIKVDGWTECNQGHWHP